MEIMQIGFIGAIGPAARDFYFQVALSLILSELIGNSTAAAISNAYYSDNRTASNAVFKAWNAIRCRHGGQSPEGVLARVQTQVQLKTPPQPNKLEE